MALTVPTFGRTVQRRQYLAPSSCIRARPLAAGVGSSVGPTTVRATVQTSFEAPPFARIALASHLL